MTPRRGSSAIAVLLLAASFLPPLGAWDVAAQSEQWSNLRPPTSPSPRAAHGMAYDAESGRVILFGGWKALSPFVFADFGDTWAYDLNANEWTNKTPLVSPPARGGVFAMAYDAQSDLVVLFGGAGSGTVLGDTWVYDFNTNIWSERNPSSAPSPRVGHRMAYDAESDRIVLHGGDTGLCETWLYDVDEDSWTEVTPNVRPCVRYHDMAYDAESDRVVLFGGLTPQPLKEETWVYDANTNSWTNLILETRPPALVHHAMTYDAQSDRVVVFGGAGTTQDGRFASATLKEGETWAFDLNRNAWTNPDSSTRPSGRGGHRMAYDAMSDRVVLFGGFASLEGTDPSDETWAFDFEALPPQPSIPWFPVVITATVAALAVGALLLLRRKKRKARERGQ